MSPPETADNNSPKTLWMHVARGFKEAHRRRPVSFYLLLTIPVVLVLGVRMMDYRDNPRLFVATLSLMLIYFFLVCLKAVHDFFSILRDHLSAKHSTYRETLNDPGFMEELSRRVKTTGMAEKE